MVLRSLERLLRARRITWRTRFVGSAAEALDELAAHPYDVIVSDLRMPHLDGASLLRRVRESFPQVARLVLSGQAATREGVEAMQVAHQCLSKPYDLAVLRNAIEGLARARKRLATPALVAAVCRFSSLPSPPSTHQRVLLALSAGVPLRELEETLERDPAMSAKILQLQRSAVLTAGPDCHSVADVLQHVDTELGRAFSLGEEMCRPLSPQLELAREPVLEKWQRHSVLVARVCRTIVPAGLRGQAFSAGILHDVGALIAACAPEARELPPSQHPTLAACLLGLWGLEDVVVEAVALQRESSARDHSAEAATELFRSPLRAALQVACHVVAEAGFGTSTCMPEAEPADAAPGQMELAREILRRINAEN